MQGGNGKFGPNGVPAAVRPQRTASNPIAIGPPNHRGGEGGGQYDSMPSSLDDDDNDRTSMMAATTTNALDLRSAFFGSTTPPPVLAGGAESEAARLTVGSLPSSRRERRLMARDGGGQRGGGTSRVGLGTVVDDDRMGMARSMPAPRAPYLSSRRESNDKLSSLPQIDLPQSASETELSSVPYGSLRESRFAQYGNSLAREQSTRVRFVGDEAPGSAFGDSGQTTSSSSRTTSGIYPQSLPLYMDAEREMMRRRRDEGNGPTEVSDDNGSPFQSQEGRGDRKEIGHGQGIGFLAERIGEAQSKIVVGSLSAQLDSMGVSSASSPTHGVGGIGSTLESASAQDVRSSVNEHRGSTRLSSNEYGTIDPQGDTNSLSGSLTALGILESSRQRQLQRGTELPPRSAQVNPVESWHPPVAGGTPSSNLNHALFDEQNTRRSIGNSSGFDGNHNDGRPESPNNPDAYGAFDLDLDE